MAKGIEYTATGEINASPEQIWEAIVTPEKVIKYHLAPLLVAELKEGQCRWRLAGHYRRIG